MQSATGGKLSTAELTKMSMCVALCCASAYIIFPLPFTPAPVTAITLTMSLAAYILKPKQTFMVILIYILIGAAGLPVFAGGTSGIGKLFGPTGGFILVWLIAYPILSAVKGDDVSFKRYAIANILTAIPLSYVGGLISMYLVMEITLAQAFTMAVLPFILGDIMKALAAAFLGVKLNSIHTSL